MVKMQSSSQQSNSHLAFSWNNPPRTAAKQNHQFLSLRAWGNFYHKYNFISNLSLNSKPLWLLFWSCLMVEDIFDKLALCDAGPFSRQLEALRWHFPLLLFLGFPNWEESLTFRQSASYSASPSNWPQVLKLLHRSSTTCSFAGSISPKLSTMSKCSALLVGAFPANSSGAPIKMTEEQRGCCNLISGSWNRRNRVGAFLNWPVIPP